MKLLVIFPILLVSVQCINGQICNIHCDGRDPDSAVDDRVPVSTELFGRQISLHISDADNMAFAEISNGDPTDHVWLDRSWDAGETWGGKLGEEFIPPGSRSVRTKMFNVDNPSARQLGALRVCAQPGDMDEIACTSWARSTVNAENQVDAGALALMQYYDAKLSKWGWWTGANCLNAVLDYIKLTGRRDYDYIINEVYEQNREVGFGDFTNDYIDDTLWWGLAWVRAFDVTGDNKFLEMAKIDCDYSYTFKDDVCGGGVWWSDQKGYKNAITNELFIKLAASLHNRISGDTKYLNQAVEVFDWFKASGMINSDNLINDGLNSDCRNNGDVTWTYNQGVILGALTELSIATGDTDGSYMRLAKDIADAVLSSNNLNPNGILTEFGCGNSDCGGDGPTFKGAFVRNLAELDRYMGTRPYRNWLSSQATSIWNNNRNSLNQFGLRWQGPIDVVHAKSHAAAFEAFVASAL